MGSSCTFLEFVREPLRLQVQKIKVFDSNSIHVQNENDTHYTVFGECWVSVEKAYSLFQVFPRGWFHLAASGPHRGDVPPHLEHGRVRGGGGAFFPVPRHLPGAANALRRAQRARDHRRIDRGELGGGGEPR